ncbi:MAG: hypothetical protein QOI01_1874 [Mycobacterium sp.]|jgi:hypothetical protein|nr:hypothetical protein [Mycobacterium sp.]
MMPSNSGHCPPRCWSSWPRWVNTQGRQWLARPDDVVEFWDGDVQPLPGIRVIRLGGHMASSAVALTPDGSLLAGDTIAGSLDSGWLSFQRNYPRHVALSAGTVQRLATAAALEFDRLYTLGGGAIETRPTPWSGALRDGISVGSVVNSTISRESCTGSSAGPAWVHMQRRDGGCWTRLRLRDVMGPKG